MVIEIADVLSMLEAVSSALVGSVDEQHKDGLMSASTSAENI